MEDAETRQLLPGVQILQTEEQSKTDDGLRSAVVRVSEWLSEKQLEASEVVLLTPASAAKAEVRPSQAVASELGLTVWPIGPPEYQGMPMDRVPWRVGQTIKRDHPDIILVGYAMKASREKELGKHSILSLVPKDGVCFVPVDLSRPLEEQLPLDAILHKASDELVHPSECIDCLRSPFVSVRREGVGNDAIAQVVLETHPLEDIDCPRSSFVSVRRVGDDALAQVVLEIHLSERMHRLMDSLSSHREVCVLDPFDNMHKIMNRVQLCSLTDGLKDLDCSSCSS
eukprot:gene2437-8761_t